MQHNLPERKIVYTYSGQGRLKLDERHFRSVRFDAVQEDDGAVLIMCHARRRIPTREVHALIGVTDEGYEVETSDELGILDPEVGDAIANDVVLYAQQLTVRRQPDESHESIDAIRFALVNFLVMNPIYNADTGSVIHPARYETALGNFRVVVEPVQDYWSPRVRLARARKSLPGDRVAHTAWLTISATDSALLRTDVIVQLAREILLIVSLAVSTNVNWVAYDVINSSGRVMKTVHRTAYTRPFSDLAERQRFGADIEVVLRDWFEHRESQILIPEELQTRIAQYLNACELEEYLESSGLVAATLLDILALRYAEHTGFERVLPEKQWKKHVVPLLGDALDAGLRAVPEERLHRPLTSEDEANLRDSLIGAYRTSFRRRLECLHKDLGILNEEKQRGAIIGTRNELVHEGRYKTSDEHTEYLSLIWACHAILLRFAGYTGKIATPERIARIIVEDRIAARHVRAAAMADEQAEQ